MRAEGLAGLEDVEAGLVGGEEHAGAVVGFDDAFVDAVARREARAGCTRRAGAADGAFVGGGVEGCGGRGRGRGG